MTAEGARTSLAPPIWVLAMAVSAANVGISVLSPAIPQMRDDLMATSDEVQLVLSAFTDLVGIWSFDARSGCETGTAWEFRADGSYNELRLPDRTPRATGKWYELGDTIFYSLARPETAARGRPKNAW